MSISHFRTSIIAAAALSWLQGEECGNYIVRAAFCKSLSADCYIRLMYAYCLLRLDVYEYCAISTISSNI